MNNKIEELVKKGENLLEYGKCNEGITYFDKAIGLDSACSQAWNGRGDCLCKMKKYEEAIKCYEKSIAIDQEDSYPWSSMGDIFYLLAKYEEAIKCYDKAVTIDQENGYAWSAMGLSLYELGKYEPKKYEEALKCYDKALEIDPEREDIREAREETLEKCKYSGIDVKISQSKTEEGMTEEPLYDNYYEWGSRGDSLYRREAYEEALKCYDKALKIMDSDYIDLWSARGDSLYEMGRYEEAVTCYDRALEIDPEREDVKEARKEALDECQG